MLIITPAIDRSVDVSCAGVITSGADLDDIGQLTCLHQVIGVIIVARPELALGVVTPAMNCSRATYGTAVTITDSDPPSVLQRTHSDG